MELSLLQFSSWSDGFWVVGETSCRARDREAGPWVQLSGNCGGDAGTSPLTGMLVRLTAHCPCILRRRFLFLPLSTFPGQAERLSLFVSLPLMLPAAGHCSKPLRMKKSSPRCGETPSSCLGWLFLTCFQGLDRRAG